MKITYLKEQEIYTTKTTNQDLVIDEQIDGFTRLSEEIKLKNIPLESAVIIGDNIKHDISAGHSVGIETIRILQGIHSDEESSNKKETPDMTFDSIKDLFKFFKDSDLAITKRLLIMLFYILLGDLYGWC